MWYNIYTIGTAFEALSVPLLVVPIVDIDESWDCPMPVANPVESPAEAPQAGPPYGSTEQQAGQARPRHRASSGVRMTKPVATAEAARTGYILGW